MGMHLAMVAAHTDSVGLLAALSGPRARLEQGAWLSSLEDMPDEVGVEHPMVVGDAGGTAILIDTSFILLSAADVTLEASRKLDGLVVSIGAETTSGTYWLFAARDGEPVRLHWDCLSRQTDPFDEGEPLDLEAHQPLDDADGLGLTAAVAELGFDLRAWSDGATKWLVKAHFGEPAPGPLESRIGEFAAAHRVPGPADRLEPRAVRRDGGFELLAPGTRLPNGRTVGRRPTATPPRTLFARLLGRSH